MLPGALYQFSAKVLQQLGAKFCGLGCSGERRSDLLSWDMQDRSTPICCCGGRGQHLTKTSPTIWPEHTHPLKSPAHRGGVERERTGPCSLTSDGLRWGSASHALAHKHQRQNLNGPLPSPEPEKISLKWFQFQNLLIQLDCWGFRVGGCLGSHWTQPHDCLTCAMI